MRTVRCSGHLGGGGEGVCPGVVSAWGAHPVPPVNKITDKCKNITFPQLLLRTLKKSVCNVEGQDVQIINVSTV